MRRRELLGRPVADVVPDALLPTGREASTSRHPPPCDRDR
ncbi:MAG: hypothetical protein AVDCRST_MAG48-378 [uncultured Friedmanniella sp.]|uniref:Uncharacterized protein n=1 Tax=uncultured Friedmanniella sp. TaxID=335381 RepID=A0A6J4JWE8_9ACTN|nr:MAG: hypothetical protein AVDCRST_MAG48-378 [uncultured Friedmanniella sp.]